MSQHSFAIANEAGAAFRADVNNALQALASCSRGTTAPSTTYAGQVWDDTTANVQRKRNAANSAWLVKMTLDESFVLSRSTNTILGLSDIGKTIIATGSFTQTFTAAATLGDNWRIDYRNDGVGTIVLSPVETIDGAATITLQPGEAVRIKCNGLAFKTFGRGLLGYTTQSANQVYAGPSSGAAALPGFRALVPADIALTSLTNSLAGDVALNVQSSFFAGPVVAQGTAGTWLCFGTVTCSDSGGAAQFIAKLWDGTTTIDVAVGSSPVANFGAAVAVSGVITNPTGNIRIDVADASAATGVIKAALSGSKNSTLTVVRIG